jgi:hypothetical protein
MVSFSFFRLGLFVNRDDARERDARVWGVERRVVARDGEGSDVTRGR